VTSTSAPAARGNRQSPITKALNGEFFDARIGRGEDQHDVADHQRDDPLPAGALLLDVEDIVVRVPPPTCVQTPSASTLDSRRAAARHRSRSDPRASPEAVCQGSIVACSGV
jgi:hypothetical protein